jgi:hypothetical protein
MVNEFSVRGSLEGADLGMISRVESTIERLLKPLVEGGQILKQSLTNTSRGEYGASYRFFGSKNVQEMVMAAVREELNGMRSKIEGMTMDIGSTSRRSYTETTERILDPRTQAAIRAQTLRAGGTSNFNKATGETTYFVPQGEARRFHAMTNESEVNYLAGRSRGLPGHSSSANIHEMATAAIARKNMTMEATARAKAAFVKTNPKSALGRQERSRRREQTGRFLKGGSLAVLSIIAGLIATSVSFLSKILGATMETARNTLNNLNSGNRTNLSGTEVTAFQNRARALGVDPNSFTNTMSMFVQRFSNPENLGDLSQVATLLQGKTADALKMITTGNVDPKQMMFSVFGDVLTSVASGKGGVLNRENIGSALSAAIAKVGQAFDPGTAELLNSIATRMMTNGQLVGGQTYSANFMQSYIEQLGAGAVAPNQLQTAAAEKGAEKFNALGSDLQSLWNSFFTQFLGQISDIATSIRNLVRPLVDFLDPGHAPQRNAEALKQNAQFTSEINNDIAFTGKQFVRDLTSKKYGMTGVFDASKSPAENMRDMKRAADSIQSESDQAAFIKRFGIDSYRARDLISQYGSLLTDTDKSAELQKQRIEGLASGNVPYPVGADAVTRSARAQSDRTAYLMGIVRRKTEAENNQKKGYYNKLDSNFLNLYQDYPDLAQFNDPSGKGTAMLDKVNSDSAITLARNMLFQQMRGSGIFQGHTVAPTEAFTFSGGANGEIVITLKNQSGKVLGQSVVPNQIGGAIKTTVYDAGDIVENMSGTSSKTKTKVGN